jgi:heme-degrading monooxygenase HmoA
MAITYRHDRNVLSHWSAERPATSFSIKEQRIHIGRGTVMSYEQTDPHVSINTQVHSDHAGPAIMISIYIVETGQMDIFLQAWTTLARIMRKQRGNLGGQMHQAIGDANVYVNYASWESLEAFRGAFENPEFWEAHRRMPEAFIGRQLLVEKVAVPGLCTA